MEQKLYLEAGEQKVLLTDFALVYREGAEMNFIGLSDPILLGQAMMCCYSKFYEALAKTNDQEVYEICMILSLDFDEIHEHVMEVRRNG